MIDAEPGTFRELVQRIQTRRVTLAVPRCEGLYRKRRHLAPPWQTDEERAAIDSLIASRRVGETVDHIAPIGHEVIIGLHVLVNLQVLSAEQNQRKGNALQVGLTLAQAVDNRMAIWRRDVDANGTVRWERYRHWKP
jgi:hypothetical protein